MLLHGSLQAFLLIMHNHSPVAGVVISCILAHAFTSEIALLHVGAQGFPGDGTCSCRTTRVCVMVSRAVQQKVAVEGRSALQLLRKGPEEVAIWRRQRHAAREADLDDAAGAVLMDCRAACAEVQ